MTTAWLTRASAPGASPPAPASCSPPTWPGTRTGAAEAGTTGAGPGGRGAEGEGGDGARRPHTRLPAVCTRSLGVGAVTDSRAVTSVCRATSVAGVETRTTPRWAGEGAGSGRGRGGLLPTLILTASLFLCPLAFFSLLPPSLSLFFLPPNSFPVSVTCFLSSSLLFSFF